MKQTVYQKAMQQISADEAEIRSKARQIQAQYNTQHPARRTNRGFRIGLAAAAAVILCGTVTAGAVSDWDYAALFRKYFSDKTGTEISYDFSGMGLDIGQQYEGEGYTLTVEGVIADTNAVYLLYNIALDESVQAQLADSEKVSIHGGLGGGLSDTGGTGHHEPLNEDENGVWHGVYTAEIDYGTDLTTKSLDYSSILTVITRDNADSIILPQIGDGHALGEVSLADITVQKGIRRDCSVILPDDINQVEYSSLYLTPMQLKLTRTDQLSYYQLNQSDKNVLPVIRTQDSRTVDEIVSDSCFLIYADGSEQPVQGSLQCSSGSTRNESGTYDVESGAMMIFRTPIDLEDVTAVRIGETVIDVTG